MHAKYSLPTVLKLVGRKQRVFSLAALFFCTGAFAADSDRTVDPEPELQRIREKVSNHLSQLRNYTCHVTVDRFLRRGGDHSVEHQDQVHFEVAFVGDKELFSGPGESRFEERPLRRIAAGGMISDDAFGAHADTILSGDVAEFKYRGRCSKDGHHAFRYDFRVPAEKSQLFVRRNGVEAIVGYTGTAWFDSETLDLIQLDRKTDRLPSSFGVNSIERIMRYNIQRIGKSDFLLPNDSELVAYDEHGELGLNIIRLKACREFTGDSQISYDAPSQH
jgi:hypothetical protein